MTTGLLTALALTLAPAPASAGTDELCMSQCYGVPGPQPKHPQWWDLSLTDDQRETRWNGATHIHEDVTGPPLSSVRGIWDGGTDRQYFHFEVNADRQIDALQDLVLVAVSDTAGVDPDIYIQFQPLNSCSAFPLSDCLGQGRAINAADITYWSASTTGSGTVWTNHGNVNPSAQWTVHEPWVEVENTGGPSPWNWKVKFALETPTESGGGQAFANQKIYGNAIMYFSTGSGGAAVEFPLLCEPSPGTNDCIILSSGGTSPLPADLPDDDRWSHLTTGNTNACDGVELMRPLVGSDHNTNPSFVPGTSIPYDLPGSQIPKISGAHLLAGFHNDTTATIPANSIEAEFRIAHWGLQYADWDDATWDLVGTALLDADVITNAYAGANLFPVPGKLQSPLYIPSSSITNDHQCMHVKIDTALGAAPVNFKTDSVYRNMNLVNASVFRRPGDLSMAHRTLPQGVNSNEVYLLVHTESMPTVEDCAKSDQQLKGCAKGGSLKLETPPVKEEPSPWDPFEPVDVDQQNNQAGAAMEVEPEGSLAGGGADPVGAPQAPAQAEPALAGKATDGIPLEELPKYVIYAFAKTPYKVNLPGVGPTPVLDYFSSYGYYVQHEGLPSQGFEHYAHIPKGEPEPGPPGLYRVNVGEDQVIAIADTIRVIDGAQEPCAKPPEVYEVLPKNEEIAMTQQLDAASKAMNLEEKVINDPQFGCKPPADRGACFEGQCAPHNPINYIEGSKYVGQFTHEAVAAVYEQDPTEDLAANPGEEASDIEDEALDTGLTDLPGGTEGCCAQASIDPQAGTRGAARGGFLALLLLMLRRGRRRRRRR
ncbi:MAG: hypothetical protein K0V04_09565 [Deltaproteobacteria bacterium]|nr:hypothetical protein [Deltaproteobacteria bacterium]